MKQKLTALLLVLLLAVTLVLPVMAAAPYVDDEAAILTLSEVETLEARAAEIEAARKEAEKEKKHYQQALEKLKLQLASCESPYRLRKYSGSMIGA